MKLRDLKRLEKAVLAANKARVRQKIAIQDLDIAFTELFAIVDELKGV